MYKSYSSVRMYSYVKIGCMIQQKHNVRSFHNNCENSLRDFTVIVYKYHKHVKII